MKIDGYTIELVETVVISPSHLHDVYGLTIQREECEGLQAWICSIFNLTRGYPVVLTDESDYYPAPTWQAAEAWWQAMTSNMRAKGVK